MKNLFVIRHSKAMLYREGQEDHDRTLNKIGKEDAKITGNWLNNLGINIDIIYSSSSLRAKATTTILTEHLDSKPKVIIDNNLYLADENYLFQYIKQIDEEYEAIALVGHEPGLKRLINLLTGSFVSGLENTLDNKFSTSAAAVILLNIPFWSSINEREGTLFKYFNNRNT